MGGGDLTRENFRLEKSFMTANGGAIFPMSPKDCGTLALFSCTLIVLRQVFVI